MVQQLSFFLIDLMKSVINNEDNLIGKADELLLQTGKEIDRCKVNNQPTAEIEYIYDIILWLKSEIIKQ